MRININSIDRIVRKAIQNGPFEITMKNEEGATIPKPEAQRNAGDKSWKQRILL